MHRSACLTLLLLLASPLLGADLRTVQQLLDAGNGEDALTLLEPHLRANPKDPRALLQRSTAQFLIGQVEPGRRDLLKAIELDPTMRQAWLNKAGLEIAEQRFSDALASLSKAKQLDPSALDNDLNIGAVRVLSGDLPGATEDFRRYLERAGRDPEAYFLVATNYAVAGYAGPAIEILRRAIAIDEKVRRAVRVDPRFESLSAQPAFGQLLETDAFQPAPGSHRLTYPVPARYQGGRGPLLPAVLDVLAQRSIRFEPAVEVGEQWALIWGALRIKVRDEGEGGAVEISAPPDPITASEFTRLTTAFTRDLEIQIAKRTMSRNTE